MTNQNEELVISNLSSDKVHELDNPIRPQDVKKSLSGKQNNGNEKTKNDLKQVNAINMPKRQ